MGTKNTPVSPRPVSVCSPCSPRCLPTACVPVLTSVVIPCPLCPLSAWLGAYEHPVVDKINQMIEDVTGLNVKTAEDLQVTSHLDSNITKHEQDG